MKKPWYAVAWLFFIELIIIFLLVPGDWTDKTIRDESVLIERSLGNSTRIWIHDTASNWYRDSIIDSGFYDGMYRTLIPTEAERQKSKGMEKMGTDWFIWVEGRIAALLNVIYQFYTRLALFLSWAPYMLILFIPAVYDGLMTREIKKTNFEYASPVIHRYSVRAVTFLFVGLLIAFFSPFVLEPLIIPTVMMASSVFTGLAFGNFQKRV